MKYSVIISALVVILVGGSVLLGLRITNLVDQVYELQSSYNTIDANYRTTLNNYNLLNNNYQVLQSNFNSLQTDFQSLTTQYNTLELSYESLEAENSELKNKVISLAASYHMVNLANIDLQKLLDEYESVPSSSNSTNTFTK